MSDSRKRVEFGDFQTPWELARKVCDRLTACGIEPDVVIEPTCGRGEFLIAAAEAFPGARSLLGFDIDAAYIDRLRGRITRQGLDDRIRVEVADFFTTDWMSRLSGLRGAILVVGNFPWVTSAAQGLTGGTNLPEKSNFLRFDGLDAITGKANFDISEWMLLAVLDWLRGRAADVAMLVKTAVARKVLAHVERRGEAVREAFLARIDAQRSFGATVDACLLVMRLHPDAPQAIEYTVHDSLDAAEGRRVGHRHGLTVGDLDGFDAHAFLFGTSPQKWRSGIKHDAAAVMELDRARDDYRNGLDEGVNLEDRYLFPLLKGSDVASGRAWREKFVLVTQRVVGEPTESIRRMAPRTWAYLEAHGERLDARRSAVYRRHPRFSVFGVGDYAFRPWRIAVCGLDKSLRFRLVGPIGGRPVMFDDTVYYLSFDGEREAAETLAGLNSPAATVFLSSLIFRDDKRPIKASILNLLDWSRLPANPLRLPATGS